MFPVVVGMVPLLVTVGLAHAAPAPPARHTMAMLGVTGGAGFDPQVLGTVEEAVLAALENTGKFAVTGRSDLARLIGFEKERQLAGCDDTSCLAEIAGVLGVTYIGSADLGRVGGESLLTFKLMEVRSATVVARVSRRVRSDAELLDSVDALMRELASRVPDPASPGDPRRFAVRAGLSPQAGVLGVGLEVRVLPYVGLALGSGTHNLGGGLSFGSRDNTGGFYADLHAVWARSWLFTLKDAGVAGGLTVGWDWRFVPWLSVKTGLGLATGLTAAAGDGVGLAWDLAVGPVF